MWKGRFVSCLCYPRVGILVVVCGHVMTARLCAAQRGGPMNTGEPCEAIHLYMKCSPSLLVIRVRSPFRGNPAHAAF